MKEGGPTMYTAQNFREDRDGEYILKWINEIYHNLGMNCMNCVWIWKRKLFQSCSSDCFQPLNIMKLQSVFYIQYSQHIKKCFKKKQISEKWKNAFMHQQPKYLKNITFLLGVIHIVRTHKNRQNSTPPPPCLQSYAFGLTPLYACIIFASPPNQFLFRFKFSSLTISKLFSFLLFSEVKFD